MVDEPTYFDRLERVDSLLLSMESDFLAVLAEDLREEAESMVPRKDFTSQLSQRWLARFKALAKRSRSGCQSYPTRPTSEVVGSNRLPRTDQTETERYIEPLPPWWSWSWW
jgi:hypothetical protein